MDRARLLILVCLAFALFQQADCAGNSVSFDDGWKFHLGDAAGAQMEQFDDANWQAVTLPHDWSIEQKPAQTNASGTGWLPGGVGWYRKEFTAPALQPDQHLWIQFGAIYKDAEVWINDHSVGKRPYGFIDYEYDLTPYLNPAGRSNTISVRVDHSDFADSRFYTGSGIIRHAYLEVRNPVQIATHGLVITTPQVSHDLALVHFQITLVNTSAVARDVLVIFNLSEPQGRTNGAALQGHVEAMQQTSLETTMRLETPALWSPDSPSLCKATVTVRGNFGSDTQSLNIGLLSFTFDPDKGFFLNGVKTIFKGVCVHEDIGGFGAAVPEAAQRRRLEMLKELGCNAIRTSHNTPAPEFLDMCDQMGFMVMDEAFDEWARPKHKWVQGRNNGAPSYDGYSKFFDQWAVTDIQAMVQRDRNHPSIILWSIGNEIDYSHDPYYDPAEANIIRPNAEELAVIGRKLHDAVKAADPTRPVTAALANINVSNKTGLPEDLDVVGYNYQEMDYVRDHAAFPKRILIGSENSQTFAAWSPIVGLPYANGQFLWTGFDYIGESSGWPTRGSSAGLIDQAGFKKPSFYFRQSLWSDKPMVAITSTTAPRAAGAGPQTRPRAGGGGQGGAGAFAGRGAPATWNFADNVGSINVGINSNCEQVELFLNDRSVGKQTRLAAQNGVFTFAVPYAPGTLRAVGSDPDNHPPTAILKTTGAPKTIHLICEPSYEGEHPRYFFVDASAGDADGNLVTTATAPVTFKIKGPGKLLLLDSGDLRSMEDFKADTRQLYQGKVLAVIERTADTGPISLDASSQGLDAGSVSVSN